MARTSSSLRRGRRPFALLFVALFAVVLVPVFAQGEPPPEPLIPNIEPEAGDEAPAWALTEREAVEAALANYAERGGPALAERELADLVPDAFALNERRTYISQVQVAQTVLDPGQGPTPTPSPAPEVRRSADVVVTVWPTPSILVRPGELITYEIRLNNLGKGDASETRVTFPYNTAQVTLVNTSLNTSRGDWLSNIGRDSFTVTFGRLSDDARRTGRVVVRVNSNLPINPSNPVKIDVRARYTWRDDKSGGDRRANWTPVLIGNGASDAREVWVGVNPERAPIGATHTFFSNRFLPNEPISTWVNRQGGAIQALSLRGTANSGGEVELRLRSTDADPDLPRGTHQIVLYGQRSGLTGVVRFIVE